MKKIILILTLTILLSGCSVLDLGDFVLPDDINFINTINELDTPKKICSYMKDNFTYKTRLFYQPDPYAFWKLKKGDCTDFANFASFVANYHGYETWQVHIYYDEPSFHIIAIYIESIGYSFSSNQFYYPKDDVYYNNFQECVDRDFLYRLEGWISYEVYDYKNNLIEKVQK